MAPKSKQAARRAQAADYSRNDAFDRASATALLTFPQLFPHQSENELELNRLTLMPDALQREAYEIAAALANAEGGPSEGETERQFMLRMLGDASVTLRERYAVSKGKGKGKGFEPFSGRGRRLDDDLNSLD